MYWEISSKISNENADLAASVAEALALMPDGVIGSDAIGTILFFSPAAERLFGYTAQEVIGRDIGLLLPEQFRGPHEAIVADFGEAEGDEQRPMAKRAEVWGLHKDGSEFPAEVSLSRQRRGQRTILTAVVRDVTELRQLERQLRKRSARLEENERRLRLALDCGQLGTWNWDPVTGRLQVDVVAQNLLGLDGDGNMDLQSLITIAVADDTSALEEAFERASQGAVFQCEFGMRLADGTRRDIALVGASPLNCGPGDSVFGVARDVTRRRAGEQQRDFLFGELNHRIANLMSVVQSVIRLTAQHHDTAQGLRQALQHRLSAVAERHQLLNQEGWTSVGLDSLLSAELRPYAAPDGSNLDLKGPPLRISAMAATSLGLVLHEFATNSAKYGALSLPSGLLAVTWQADLDRDTLNITWIERGGPEVTPPQRKGFGSSLIERVLLSQFDGDLNATYPSTGFEAHIRLPLGKLQE